ncbi:uncharacterized protein LOC126983555 isoform X1 [Eriocheir sinensis]|uniref:uncharacterized protein LOC126983555 isoform X1 n=1 Tax=Eriocheir sinensis TaxID=95602 RepID=UPI0021C870EF|nr:uncharacterized protein LOC126983555 isoform X1 [Eriocheir sinensis]
MDVLLYTTNGASKKVLWRPGGGRSVVLRETDYRLFSQVGLTVHLYDALTICGDNGMIPKPITALSTLRDKTLQWQKHHPCRNLRVLWFGAKLDGEDEDAHDWYGNVQFAFPTDVMMHHWRNFYLVEMLTTSTHTTTRILVTNADYSSVLPPYDPRTPGGSWRLTPDGRHECLADCRRYSNQGCNGDGHILEFMIEVEQFQIRTILAESTLSFRNHEQGGNGGPHDCHRSGRLPMCPTPCTKDVAAKIFFEEHQRSGLQQDMATPRLAPSAERLRMDFPAGREYSF